MDDRKVESVPDPLGAARSDPARIGHMLEAMTVVTGTALAIFGAPEIVWVLVLGVIASYLARNPLRHVAAGVAVASALCILLTVVVVSAGAIITPDSPVLQISIHGPQVGAAGLVVISMFGLVLHLREKRSSAEALTGASS